MAHRERYTKIIKKGEGGNLIMSVENGLRRQYETDGEGYRLHDSGCYMASRYIGKASRCLECPFGKCILDIHTRGGPVHKDRIKQLVISKTKGIEYGSNA